MQKGDIILVNFPFTNFSGFKLRPAVIVAVQGNDITACFITTRIFNLEDTDILLIPNQTNGLLKQSLIRPLKIMTFENNNVAGKLGKLSSAELLELNVKLRIGLQL